MTTAKGVDDFPIPPNELVQRIGPMGEVDPAAVYEKSGRESRQMIEAALPDDWDWNGKRVLDFGCGSGRVLRQFAAESEAGEFWGCDLDEPSIEWLQQNLEPPFRFFLSGEEPDVAIEDGKFDLIYALSVYTHFTDNWAAWLREHHRLLADGGILFATVLGAGMSEALIAEDWDEDRVGHNTLLHGNPWDIGGPIAFDSPWWIRAHWGRAFEIVALDPGKVGVESHGHVVASKKPVQISTEELEREEPGEPRELAALRHQVQQLIDETERIRGGYLEQQKALEALQGVLAERDLKEEQALEEFRGSHSWKVTAPLRAIRHGRRN